MGKSKRIAVIFLILGLIFSCTTAIAGEMNFDYVKGFNNIDIIFHNSQNVVVPIEEWKMDRFTLYNNFDGGYGIRTFSAAGGGSIQVNAPKGDYHIGVMMYEFTGDSQYLTVEVNGEPQGAFTADFRDASYYLYFTEEPLAFNGGEQVVLRANKYSYVRIAGIIFMPKAPEPVHKEYLIKNVESKYQPGFPYREDWKDAVRLTWTTTWPTTGEVLIEGSGGSITLPFNTLAQLHKIDWEGFEPGASYKWTIKTITPEGKSLVEGPYEFIAALPPEPASVLGVKEISLPVSNTSDIDLINWPTETGVPFAQGELGSGSKVQILGEDGEEVIAQTTVLSRWPDNSVRWLLVEFMANVPGGKTREFKLRYGEDVTPSQAPAGLVAQTNYGFEINTGPMKLIIDPDNVKLPGDIWVNPKADGTFTGAHRVMTGGEAILEMPDGTKYSSIGRAEVARIESEGPIRATIYLQGHHTNSSGKMFLYEARLHAFRGSSLLWLEYTFGNDAPGNFTTVKSLGLQIPFDKSVDSVTFGGDKVTHKVPSLTGSAIISQMLDTDYEVTSDGKRLAGGKRAIGWSELSLGGLTTTIAPQYFWQNYPKQIEVTRDNITIGLMPTLQRGQYSGKARNQAEDTRLFFYLQNDGYKLRAGMNKRHQFLFAFGENADNIPIEYVDTSLRASVPREQYALSRAFGPMGVEPGSISDLFVEKLDFHLGLFTSTLESQRAYGMMNFGDWWGERQLNWGNLEYDLAQGLFMSYVHTGNDLAFILGERAALHQMDVDVARQHWDPDEVGYHHEHCMAHTGGYWAKNTFGSGMENTISNLGHVFNNGLVTYYHMTGDPMGLETAIRIADHYIRRKSGDYSSFNYFNNWNFDAGRFAGWPLIMFMTAYKGTGDPYYLNAARLIMDRVYENEAAGGAWPNINKSRGIQQFVLSSTMMQTGVLITGILEYYYETGDQRVPPMIVKATEYIAENALDENAGILRETTALDFDQPHWAECIDVGLAAAYEFSGDETIKKVLFGNFMFRINQPKYGSTGKALAQMIRFEPMALKVMDEIAEDFK
jgi:hypothetical protein